ncbi:MAG TPA: PAS domain-containing protein [Sphingobium sp.]|nr:PAS domain-containing protein [Sphingobium sp.]
MAQSLILSHSWPLYEAAERVPLLARPDLADQGDAGPVGIWTCLLETGALIWSPAVYRLFGLPPGEPPTRALAVSLYRPGSRRAMEELRAHAIKHHRGFTLDAQISRPDGARRWMRLSALPVVAGRRAVRLTGTKQDVTADYDGPD